MRLRATRLSSIRNRRIATSAPSAWTPAALGAALSLWLDANDSATITLNGSTVSQWNDKSANGRHVSQATAANQPAYQTAGFAGKPGIYFNGSTTHLFNTSPFMYDAGSVSVFAAMRPAPSALNQFFLGESNSANTLSIYAPIVNRASVDQNDQSFYWRGDSGASDVGSLSFDNGMAEANRIAGLTDTGVTVTGYNNGAVGAARNYTRSATTLNRFTIGGLVRSSFGLGMTSTAGEIVITTSVLSNTDRQKLEGYLAWKWGLEGNLPVGHPFKNTPPTA